MILLDAVILACSFIGLLISLYFTLVYYHFLKPDTAIVPVFCRLDEATCQQLLRTRNAKILGAPNFLFGLLYYAGIMWYAVGIVKSIPATAVICVSLFTLFLGIYLVYGLVAKLKIHCVLCYTSHACNLIIFIALMAKY